MFLRSVASRRHGLRGTFGALLLLPVLVIASISKSQVDDGGARIEDGRLILEEITIKGELRTPQAMFLILKSTPSLSNVLLERSFLEDIVRPIYPGAFADESLIGSERTSALPWWFRYGTVAVLGGLSAYDYTSGDEEEGLTFGVMAGLDLVGNLILDLVGI
jgi:hypothetical protein